MCPISLRQSGFGAKRLDQLQDNLAAIELTLTQDESFPLLSY